MKSALLPIAVIVQNQELILLTENSGAAYRIFYSVNLRTGTTGIEQRCEAYYAAYPNCSVKLTLPIAFYSVQSMLPIAVCSVKSTLPIELCSVK